MGEYTFQRAEIGQHSRSIRVVLIAAALQAFGCSSPCDNEVISSRLSPDGQLKAVVFIRSCGATTPVVTEVSVLPADAGMPEGWANAVTLSDDPAHPVQRSTEAIQVLLKWDSGRRLRVSFPQAAVAQKRASGVKGVAIEYSTF
jgi:hypothetical protein